MEYTTFLQNHFPPQTDPSIGDYKTLDEVEHILTQHRVKLPKKERLLTHLNEFYEKQKIGTQLYYLM